MKKFATVKYLLVLLLLQLNNKSGTAQSKQAGSNMSVADRIAVLSMVWSSARQNFANFDLTKVNWDSAYKATIPLVLAAKNTADVYKQTAKMVALLKDGHTGIYYIPGYPKKRLPLKTALVEGKVIITEINNDSLISQHGLNVGDEIIAVDKKEVFDYATKNILPYQFASTPQDLDVKTYTHSLLYANPQKPVTVKVLKKDGSTSEVSIPRNMQVVAGPPFTVRILPGEIALLTLNDFQNKDYKKLFDSLYQHLLPAKAVIIDVRRHTGGDGAQGNYILSHFIDKDITGAKSKTKQYIAAWEAWNKQEKWKELEPSILKPIEGKQRFLKPIVILTGAQTYSAAEDFCVAFDISRRGIKIGQSTAGSTGQPLRIDLPGNGIFMVCTKRDSYPDGKEFIGIGIQPEIFVKETIDDIRTGNDSVLQKAIAHIVNKN